MAMATKNHSRFLSIARAMGWLAIMVNVAWRVTDILGWRIWRIGIAYLAMFALMFGTVIVAMYASGVLPEKPKES